MICSEFRATMRTGLSKIHITHSRASGCPKAMSRCPRASVVGGRPTPGLHGGRRSDGRLRGTGVGSADVREPAAGGDHRIGRTLARRRARTARRSRRKSSATGRHSRRPPTAPCSSPSTGSPTGSSISARATAPSPPSCSAATSDGNSALHPAARDRDARGRCGASPGSARSSATTTRRCWPAISPTM